ncbi:UTP--glucose-1-phosphate uridylyltransferase [Nematocida displodere]|uniref:UTP--glucose-1-phosphate uridylyltransferase n=1 Tax=Nematocida displodere TaxID=1805483 RepID=A0A177EG24_9MICR|nr:UTP--glucose-1-phosphate uridylyltransferase [Nematocida displodere]
MNPNTSLGSSSPSEPTTISTPPLSPSNPLTPLPATPRASHKTEPSEPSAASRNDTVDDFKKRGIDGLVQQMKEELSALKDLGDSEESNAKFLKLFVRYISNRSEKLDWEKISPPPASMITDYSEAQAPKTEDISGLLNKVAVLKLNGGLGTSMGCLGPKSAIEVKDHLNFIDLSVRQIEHLNTTHSASVPFILMNSFNTQTQTKGLISKYKSIWTFEQSKFPRISADTLLPVSSSLPSNSNECYYPPGHGDVFESLNDSGMLDKLISEGKEYIFISNIDNLKSVVDLSILSYIEKNQVDFLMEVTKKTRADIKGGTLIDYNGSLRLLEIAQVPEYHKTDFTSIRKFKIFNTNSLWVSTSAIKDVLSKSMELEVIENKKKLSTGEEVIQLETAIGASIKYFNNAKGMVVPRDRFLPVKTCSDLFLLQSSLFSIKHGTLVMCSSRVSETLPIIKLVGSQFKRVEDFKSHIKGPINIDDLDHLTISGDIYLGKNITLKGTVIIIAEEGQTIYIPDGTILDDKIVSGSLHIIDH